MIIVLGVAGGAFAALVIYLIVGVLLVERRRAIYRDRPRLVVAFMRAGGPLRRETPEALALAQCVVQKLDIDTEWDAQIRDGVMSNFSHAGAVYPTQHARDEAQFRLWLYAKNEADRARSNFIEETGIFLCCMHSDEELRTLSDSSTPVLHMSVARARGLLTLRAAAQCVGAAVKRLRAEGGMHTSPHGDQSS